MRLLTLLDREAETGRTEVFMDYGFIKSRDFRAKGVVSMRKPGALEVWLS